MTRCSSSGLGEGFVLRWFPSALQKARLLNGLEPVGGNPIRPDRNLDEILLANEES